MDKTKIQNNITFACPNCRRKLIQEDLALVCNFCVKEYPITEGVICFLDQSDDFYEGNYKSTTKITFSSLISLKAILFFYFYKDFYLNAIRKYARKKSNLILDIGCAGGVRYLAQKGDVVGLDLSLDSLKSSVSFYKSSVQADALNLPFSDNNFDLITSSFTFEHIAPSDKVRFLQETQRVLKPGGRMILQFDCDNNNLLFRWLKKDQTLYKQQIIEHDHHYGLQLASENLCLIREAGFSVVKYWALNKTFLQNLAVYGWIGPYGYKSTAAAFAHRTMLTFEKSKLLWVPYNALLNWIDILVEKVFPLDYARVLVVVAEKPITH